MQNTNHNLFIIVNIENKPNFNQQKKLINSDMSFDVM